MASKKQITTLADLSTDRRNANRGTERGRSAVARSLEAYGAGRSVLADKHGNLIAGNKTVEAALEQGLGVRVVETHGDEIVVVQRTDLDLYADERARKLAYADNRASELGLDWSAEQIAEDLAGGLDLSEMWSEEEIDALVDGAVGGGGAGGDAPEPEVDRAEELREKWQVESGQLWQIGRHRLLCGDSTRAEDVDRLMDGKTAAACVTSPPYNAGALEIDGQEETQRKYRSDEDRRSEEEYSRFLIANVGAILPVSDVVFYNIQMLAANRTAIIDLLATYRDHFKDLIYWVKATGAPHIQHGVMNSRAELILCFGRERRPTRAFAHAQFSQGTYWNVIEGGNAAGNEYSDIHKATFPAYLPSNIVENFTAPGDVVMDCFGGTGTTAVVCEQLGRDSYLCDKDPAYVAVTLERLSLMGLTPERLS